MYKHYFFFKRCFDIIFSFTALTLVSPIFVVIIFCIKSTSEGPIFYLQKRLGANNKIFNCIKFRTMVVNSDKSLIDILNKNSELKKEFKKHFKLKNDPRITKFGKFLRSTSLDELPQFINVIFGQMSVIGPRPIVEEEKERYGNEIYNLLSVRPGITGLWQVEGRSKLSYVNRRKLDIYYTKNICFKLDFYIFMKTILVIFFPLNKGAY